MTERPANYGHIFSLIHERPWLITPRMMETVSAVIEARLRSEDLSDDELRAARVADVKRDRTMNRMRAPSVAVLPVFSVLDYRTNLIMELFGGTSTQLLARDLRAVMRDDSIGAVILDIDSPGGAVDGIPELFEEMMEARAEAKKPVIAVANTFMASGALWISAAADRIVASPSAEVGSVGVIAKHVDFTKAYDRMGVKVTTVTSTDAPHKAEFNPDEELSPEDKERLQSRVDDLHADFVRSLARGRGVSQRKVAEEFGKGRMLSAKEALDVGMIDEIETFDNVVRRMAARGSQIRPLETGTASVGVQANREQDDKEVTSGGSQDNDEVEIYQRHMALRSKT